MGPDIQPNTAEAISFLQRWPAAFPHLTAIHVDPETHKKGLIEARAFSTPVDWAAVAKWIDERQGKANLYFTVNTLMRPLNKKAGKTDVAEVVALHIDIDVPAGEAQEETAAQLEARVREYEPAPSVIISSGGGVQAFWILNEASRLAINGDEAEASNAERYTRGLEDAFTNERGAKADRCHNVDRIMRLPGTINVPDYKKVEKGRGPALARLVKFDDTTHALALFKPAQSMDIVTSTTGGPAAKAASKDRVNIKVDWEQAERIYRLISLDDLKTRGVEEHAMLSLQYGDNRKTLHEHHAKIGHRVAEGPYDSDSLITLAVATSLLKAGLSNEEAASIMTDPQYPGNAHVTKMEDKKKKRRAVERALGKATADIEANDARARATAAGMPVWSGGCFDQTQLHPIPNLKNTEIGILGLGISARADLFHHKLIITYEGVDTELRNLVGENSDASIGAIRVLMSNRWGFDPGDKLVHDALVHAIGRVNAFDPVLDYLDEVQEQWDGVARLDTWVCKYLGVEDTPLNRAIGACTLKAAVRRARKPGCKYDCITVLEGPEGTRKSTCIRVLAGDANFSDQTILGVSDREAQELLNGVWLFECADLSGMARAEIERTKAFASRQSDRARPAYGRTVVEQPRRCVVFATTNDRHYLLSQTGNRRFLPLETTVIDLQGLIDARDQLWAEAATREAAGENIELPESLWLMAALAQEERRAVDPWESILEHMPRSVTVHDDEGRQEIRILWETQSADGEIQCCSGAAILEHVLRVPRHQQNTAHGKRMATAMAKCGWLRTKNGLVRFNGEQHRGYYRKVPEGLTPFGGAKTKAEQPGPRGLGATAASEQAGIPF